MTRRTPETIDNPRTFVPARRGIGMIVYAGALLALVLALVLAMGAVL
jgi:hypothetical protein